MKLRRLSILFTFILVLSTVFARVSFAESTPTTPVQDKNLNVVALGDSITFGYPPPSTTGFPDHITGACNVTKFGGSGATSTDLLAAISNDLVNFSLKIKKADVVTVNIGSNDFIGATGLDKLFAALQPIVKDPATLQAAIASGELDQVIAENPLTNLTEAQGLQYGSTLTTIVTMIKTQNPNVPIILYNLYNPIVLNPALGDELNAKLGLLHSFVEAQLPSVNAVINGVGNSTGAHIADAYTTFANQPSYIIPFDIHPTTAGHKALAQLADNVINSLPNEDQENNPNICPKKCSGDEPKEPIVCTHENPNPNPGEDPGDNPGENPDDNPPVDQPIENPTQQPSTDTNNQNSAPVIQQQTPEKIKTANNFKTYTLKSTGNRLPNTATPIYNYLVLGLGIVMAGLVTFKLQQSRRRNQNI